MDVLRLTSFQSLKIGGVGMTKKQIGERNDIRERSGSMNYRGKIDFNCVCVSVRERVEQLEGLIILK